MPPSWEARREEEQVSVINPASQAMPLRITVLPFRLVHNHRRQEVRYYRHQILCGEDQHSTYPNNSRYLRPIYVYLTLYNMTLD